MKTLLKFVFCLGLLMTNRQTGIAGDTFYINYQNRVPENALRHYKECILGATVENDLRSLPKDHVYYGYLSLVEVASDADYMDDIRALHIPVMAKNRVWNSDLVDIRNKKWKRFILQRVRWLVDKGFNGVFFDTVESIDQLESKHKKRHQGEFRKAGIDILRAVRKDFPELKLILNRGFSILEETKTIADGVLVESFSESYDYRTKTFRPVSKREQQWLLEKLEPFIKSGNDVYIIDFCDPTNKDAIRNSTKNAGQHHFKVVQTSPDLTGKIHGPVKME